MYLNEFAIIFIKDDFIVLTDFIRAIEREREREERVLNKKQLRLVAQQSFSLQIVTLILCEKRNTS